MQRKILYSFDNTTSTGIDQVPINGVILIENSGGLPKFTFVNHKTGVDKFTTIA